MQTDIYIYIYIYKYRGISNRTRLLASLRSLRSRRSATSESRALLGDPDKSASSAVNVDEVNVDGKGKSCINVLGVCGGTGNVYNKVNVEGQGKN